jgi:hypothetical protein
MAVRDLDSGAPIALVNQPEVLHRWRQPVVVPTIVALALTRPIPELAITYGSCGVAAVLEVSEARAPMRSIALGLALRDVGGPVTLHADLSPINTPNIRLRYPLPWHCTIGRDRAIGGVQEEWDPLGILRSSASALQEKQHGNYR